jgi:hypothetical protein
VSDNYIRLIPTAPSWKPDGDAAEAATRYVAGLFAGTGGFADEVVHEYYGQVAFIDSGVNTGSAACSSCGAAVDLAWVFEVMDERQHDLSPLHVVLPSCGETSSLDDLEYDWPMGLASFEISLLNATRAQYELQPDELERVGSLLGHPVRQVLAHY